MDYSLCKALSYNMSEIPTALVMYDIMCQYGVHLQKRVHQSPEISIPSSLELRTGIGLFHIHGHQDDCLPRFSPSYIPGAKQVDGEVIETLWAPLNDISRSLRGMSLFHRQEALDAHMNHSNWKKMVRIGICHIRIHSVDICLYAIHIPVPTLLRRWKALQDGLNVSAEAFEGLCKRFEAKTEAWLEEDREAQSKRQTDPTAMDIYDTTMAKGMRSQGYHMHSLITSMISTISWGSPKGAGCRGEWR
jgi:post-segregation antitoxin (ccd killing protein)